MKPCLWIISLPSLVLAVVPHALGQGGFENLNFESAIVPSIPPNQTAEVPSAAALPGWLVYYASYQQSTVGYNGVSAGGAAVTLIDRHTLYLSASVIDGNFTATLSAGTYYPGLGGGIIAAAAIAQTGTIPTTAKTLLFDARLDTSALVVTYGPSTLLFYPQSTGPNYTTFGADVSALAGLTAELRFTEHPGTPPAIHKTAYLDNIRFSDQPIPEPSALALAILGASLVGLSRRHKKAT